MAEILSVPKKFSTVLKSENILRLYRNQDCNTPLNQCSLLAKQRLLISTDLQRASRIRPVNSAFPSTVVVTVAP